MLIFSCRYTAVGVFVLGRMFRESWGAEAVKKQAEFNHMLEVISMYQFLPIRLMVATKCLYVYIDSRT